MDDLVSLAREVKAIVDDNGVYLEEFQQWLRDSGLKDETVVGHAFTAMLFLDSYLAQRERAPMEEGRSHLDGFYLVYREHMGPSPSTVKSTAVSIKKFYRCMAENNQIPMDEYKRIAAAIKERTPVWQERYRRTSRS